MAARGADGAFSDIRIPARRQHVSERSHFGAEGFATDVHSLRNRGEPREGEKHGSNETEGLDTLESPLALG
jgi:hypothetical protein